MIGNSLRTGLRQDGYTVDWVRDGAAAELATAATAYDAILLDLGLPGRSGLELLAHWRKQHNPVPELIVTARDAVADRVGAQRVHVEGHHAQRGDHVDHEQCRVVRCVDGRAQCLQVAGHAAGGVGVDGEDGADAVRTGARFASTSATNKAPGQPCNQR